MMTIQHTPEWATWLSPLQAAKLLDLSPERVRQLLSEGRLEHVTTSIGRLISPDAVAAMVRERGGSGAA